MDCFTAPCMGGCPIRQDIPEYIELCRKGQYASALRLITEKNPLPFITGTICAHNCMTKCTRNFYEEPVNIRATKLVAAEKGYDTYMAKLRPPVPAGTNTRVAVVGGGPTGMAAAYFIGRAGIPVTLYEKTDRLGGIVRHVIPAFRISDGAIDKDEALMRKMGVDVKLSTPAPSAAELKAMGYTHIFYAVGAGKAGALNIPGNVVPVIAWLRDMKAGKDVSLGHVAVVGGGDTACEEATYLASICRKVYMIVRKPHLRASKAMQQRVFNTPNIEVLFEHNTAEVLGDDSGVTGALLRRNDGSERKIDIAGFFLAIGHHPNTELFAEQLALDAEGYIKVEPGTSKTSVEGVFAAGDVKDPHYRQAITAAASGCVAALDCERFLLQ